MLLRSISAALLALVVCACVRADDGCKCCEEKKPKCEACDACSTCEKIKRCSSPVKNFFVHSVGGSIGGGFGFNKCNTCSSCEKPKSDCGCGK